LIREVLNQAGVPDVDEVFDEIVAWRKGKNRMRKVPDLGYVTRLNAGILQSATPFLTVHSGLKVPGENRIGNIQYLGPIDVLVN